MCTCQRATLLLTLAILWLVGGRNAHATLLEGKQMQLSTVFPTIGSAPNYTSGIFTVGPGPEITPASGNSNGEYTVVDLEVDVSNAEVTFTFPQITLFVIEPFAGYELIDLSDGVAPFTGAYVDPSSTITGFTNSDISSTSTTLYLNMEGLVVPANGDLTIAFVPEPSSVSLLLVGVGLLGCLWWVQAHRRTSNKISTQPCDQFRRELSHSQKCLPGFMPGSIAVTSLVFLHKPKRGGARGTLADSSQIPVVAQLLAKRSPFARVLGAGGLVGH
jgi:PEP-CTERM motif